MASANKRRDMDLMKLMMSDYEVEVNEESRHEFAVKFHGPKDTPYEGGVWQVRVCLPKQYPFKSPSIGFLNRMFHPNVEERSGAVCLDVINQTWSPMFDLINVFDVFLPQLLRYPNPSDPLNGEAAALLLREPDRYNRRVKEYVAKYASSGSTKKAPAAKPTPSVSSERVAVGAPAAASSAALDSRRDRSISSGSSSSDGGSSIEQDDEDSDDSGCESDDNDDDDDMSTCSGISELSDV